MGGKDKNKDKKKKSSNHHKEKKEHASVEDAEREPVDADATTPIVDDDKQEKEPSSSRVMEEFESSDSSCKGEEIQQKTTSKNLEGEEAKHEVDDDGSDNGEDEETTKKRRKRKRKRANKKDKHDEDKDDKQDDLVGVVDNDEKAAQVSRTAYVEGLPFAAQPDQVREFFVQHGCADIQDLRLPVWQDSGRLRGYGHVVFASESSYNKAVKELTGKYLQGRYLTIQPALKPKAIGEGQNNTSEPSKTVMLHNLSYQAAEEDIEIVLAKFGNIAEGGVRVVRHSATGQSKGFAYVEFEDLDSAVAVMKSPSPPVILGRPCRLDYDHGRVRGSFRTADRKLWQKEHGRDKKKRVEQ